MRIPLSPGRAGGSPSAGRPDPSPAGTPPVVPGEVFAAQLMFLAALTVPTVVAVATSLPTSTTVFTSALLLAVGSALLSALLGSLGIDRPGATATAATVIAALDVVVCSLLFYGTPGGGFYVLAVLPVVWSAVQLPAAGRGLVLATGLVGLLVAQQARDASGLMPWQVGATAVLNLSLLLVVASWAGARWRRRNRSQRRLLESQTRLVGSALDAARTQEQVLAEVLDVVDFVVVTVGADGAVTANRAAEELARRVGAVDAAAVVRDGPLYLADGTTPLEPTAQPLALARAGVEVEQSVVRLGHPGPTQVPLSISVRKVVGQRVDRFVLIARDISTEVADAQARDDAVAAVSHEIKTPLTSALGYLELALSEPDLGEGSRELVEVALDNTERMLALSQDFLAARSRAPGAALTLVPEPCRPDEVVRHAVEGVRPAAAERLVTVTLDAATRTTVLADPLRVRQVVDNLLGNAVKYNRYDGRIDVAVRDAVRPTEDATPGSPSEQPGVEVVVADTGVGMSEADAEALFTRFYRTDQARSSTVQGTGLGLSIAREIVEAHGGRIEVSSVLDEGTTVTVWLPVAPGVATSTTPTTGAAR